MAQPGIAEGPQFGRRLLWGSPENGSLGHQRGWYGGDGIVDAPTVIVVGYEIDQRVEVFTERVGCLLPDATPRRAP